jgi:hypothetical protein
MIRMCSYVNRSLEEVVEVLGQADLESRLGTVAAAALGDEPITVVPEPLARLTDNAAHVPVAWRAVGQDGTVREGRASIDAIVVRSGSEPRTELLITLWGADAFAGPAIARTRRFLDELTDQLSGAPDRPGRPGHDRFQPMGSGWDPAGLGGA